MQTGYAMRIENIILENIRHSFPTLSLSINLHNCPIILSILFLLLQFSMTVTIYLLFTVL